MVYVDPLMAYGTSATWRWTHSCHMWADSPQELHAFASRLGLRRDWFQLGKCGRFPHYDLTESKRRQAVRLGAVPLDRQGAVMKWAELGFIENKLAEQMAPLREARRDREEARGTLWEVRS